MLRTDLLFQVSTCGWYSRLILLQDELLCAETVVLYVRRPVKHAWIKIESLQSHSQPTISSYDPHEQLRVQYLMQNAVNNNNNDRLTAFDPGQPG